MPLPTDLHIPTTVQGVLASRIDRLTPDEKALLQQLAVIGRQFPLSLVRHVLPQPEDELYRLLSSLQHKEFLYEQPAFPEVEYIFKHALTQEVAYGTVLHEQRKALHERTAQAIEALYVTSLDERYSELVHHYTRSGKTGKAIEYLQKAGQQAMQRSAHVEALNHLTKGLELLNTLPDTPERAQQEIPLQLALGTSLMATKGFAVPEVGTVYARALALCRQVGETPQLFPVLAGLRTFYTGQGEFQTGRELGEQLLRLAQSVQDLALLVEAHVALGLPLFLLGELGSAREHFEQAIALCDLRQQRAVRQRYGPDMGVIAFPSLAQVLWMLGYPDQARERSREALTRAQEMTLSFSTTMVWAFTIEVHEYLHDIQAVRAVGRSPARTQSRAGVFDWAWSGHPRAWLGTGHAGARRGRHPADPPGPGCSSGHRGGVATAL